MRLVEYVERTWYMVTDAFGIPIHIEVGLVPTQPGHRIPFARHDLHAGTVEDWPAWAPDSTSDDIAWIQRQLTHYNTNDHPRGAP